MKKSTMALMWVVGLMGLMVLGLTGCGGGGGDGSVDPCADTTGDGQDFIYEWSSVTGSITFTNDNSCDSFHVWAASTPLCDGCDHVIVDVSQSVAPGETLDVVIAESPDGEPEIIYSLDNGDTYSYPHVLNGASESVSVDVLLLDIDEGRTGTLALFADMFDIGPDETVNGDCASFSWVDRFMGEYGIDGFLTNDLDYCFVGDISGIPYEGDPFFLPDLRYFVTDKSGL
jgi:hypothetical protein